MQSFGYNFCKTALVLSTFVLSTRVLAVDKGKGSCAAIFGFEKRQSTVGKLYNAKESLRTAKSTGYIARKKMSNLRENRNQKASVQDHVFRSGDSVGYGGVHSVDNFVVTGVKHFPTHVVASNLGISAKTKVNNRGTVIHDDFAALNFHFSEWSIPKSTKILSVGEGMSELVADLVRSGYEALGIDFWYNGTFENKTEVASFNDSLPYYLVQGRAEDIPFPNGAFDLVVSHQALKYVKDIDVALKEIMRVLRPGGEARIFSGCRGGGCDIYIIEAVQNLRLNYTNIESSVIWIYEDGFTPRVDGNLLIIKKPK